MNWLDYSIILLYIVFFLGMGFFFKDNKLDHMEGNVDSPHPAENGLPQHLELKQDRQLPTE